MCIQVNEKKAKEISGCLPACACTSRLLRKENWVPVHLHQGVEKIKEKNATCASASRWVKKKAKKEKKAAHASASRSLREVKRKRLPVFCIKAVEKGESGACASTNSDRTEKEKNV